MKSEPDFSIGCLAQDNSRDESKDDDSRFSIEDDISPKLENMQIDKGPLFFLKNLKNIKRSNPLGSKNFFIIQASLVN